jgi:L-threonylcarbamoyladenylate synthase
MTQISSNIETAKAILEAGELVAIPTETVYGLAANAFSETAVKKIFALKKRPFFNPLIVHIASISDLEKIANNIPPLAYKLAENFWPGPLTLLLEKNAIIPDCVTAGNATVAVRVPNHALTLELLKQLPFPVAAPSANPFMSISPTKPEHVKKYFDGNLKFILDGGACKQGIESTIIGFQNNQAVLYRDGSCEIAEIEKITGKLLLAKTNTANPEAPGMLKRHYAPNTPLFLTADYKKMLQKNSDKKVGILTFTSVENESENAIYKYLSENESLKEAASNLYATLIDLDRLKLDLIIAVYLPNKGLGKTLNDRLERASASVL